MKEILTKTQAVRLLKQIEQDKIKQFDDSSKFVPVDENHAYFKLSCVELEKKIFRYFSADNFVSVEEDPVTSI